MMRLSILILVLVTILPTHTFSQISDSTYKPLIQAAKQSHSSAVIVWKNGEQVVEYHNKPNQPKIYSRSITKSVVSLAIAHLLDKETLDSLDTPVYHFYPEWKQGQKKEITIRHIMNHSTGLQNVDRTNVEIYPAPDAIQLALCASVVDSPGTTSKYNNKAVNLLSGIVYQLTGQQMDDYLGDTIFKELNITDYDWQSDDTGNSYSMSGFKVYPSDLAKIGRLVLQNGIWNGKQVISKERMSLLLDQGHPVNMERGLLWWRIPKTTEYVIDDQQIRYLEQAGVPNDKIATVENIKGSYSNRGDLIQTIMQQFESRNEFASFRKAILGNELHLWRESKQGPIVGYEAKGSSGQYLVIYPEQDVVAVRMVEVTDSYQPKTHSFSNFSHLVYTLSK